MVQVHSALTQDVDPGLILVPFAPAFCLVSSFTYDRDRKLLFYFIVKDVKNVNYED